MRTERIRIQCELSQSTFGGGLNANWKWIGLTYMIILSHNPLALEPIPCLVCVKTRQRAQACLPDKERFGQSIDQFQVYKLSDTRI